MAVAGVAFGNDLVRDSLIREMGGVLGQESGELVKSMLAKSSDPKTGTSATIFGIVMLLVTASGSSMSHNGHQHRFGSPPMTLLEMGMVRLIGKSHRRHPGRSIK